jgi:hypothetical protein
MSEAVEPLLAARRLDVLKHRQQEGSGDLPYGQLAESSALEGKEPLGLVLGCFAYCIIPVVSALGDELAGDRAKRVGAVVKCLELSSLSFA